MDRIRKTHSITRADKRAHEGLFVVRRVFSASIFARLNIELIMSDVILGSLIRIISWYLLEGKWVSLKYGISI